MPILLIHGYNPIYAGSIKAEGIAQPGIGYGVKVFYDVLQAMLLVDTFQWISSSLTVHCLVKRVCSVNTRFMIDRLSKACLFLAITSRTYCTMDTWYVFAWRYSVTFNPYCKVSSICCYLLGFYCLQGVWGLHSGTPSQHHIQISKSAVKGSDILCPWLGSTRGPETC